MPVEKATKEEKIPTEKLIEKYMEEPDASARIGIAEQIFLDSADYMGALYLKMNTKEQGQTETIIEEKTRTVREFTQENLRNEKPHNDPRTEAFRGMFLGFAMSGMGFGDAELTEGIKQAGVRKFVEEVGLNGDMPAEMTAPVAWLVDKMENKWVMVIDSESIQDPEMKQKRKELAEKAGSPFSLVDMYETMGKDPESNFLVVCIDHLPQNFSGAEWLLSLAHERGHDILSNARFENPSTLGESEIVFREFFAMMEELREFEHIRENGMPFPPELLDYYKVPEIHKNLAMIGEMPNGDITIRAEFNDATWNLTRAYVHSIETYNRVAQFNTIKKMQLQGASTEDIQAEIEKMKIITTPVLDNQDVKWRFERKEE